MQCQLLCTKKNYCDFIVWTTTDIHIERIHQDSDFIATCVAKSKSFFMKGILPELLGKFFSRAPKPILMGDASHSPTSTQTTAVKLYCYCQQAESGQMVGCDNTVCPYEWFHFPCLKITVPPKRKTWYCPDCRKLPQFKRKIIRKTH